MTVDPSELDAATLEHLLAIARARERDDNLPDKPGTAFRSAVDALAERSDPATNEAWDRTHSTAGLADRVVTVLRRYIVFTFEEQAWALALWVLHTYVFGLFDTTPYLDVSSPAKQSGKSRLLELLSMLAARPWPLIEGSAAVLFRKVSKTRPTLLVDEVDATFGKKAELTQDIRAIFDSGWRPGFPVARCVGKNHEPTDFEVFCPKAFAGLAGLPDTVKDRTVLIELRRKARHERTERMRLSKVKVELAPLAEDLAAWSKGAEDGLVGAEPELPEPLSDRQQDTWEVLVAIADHAGGDWPARARQAAVKLSAEHDANDRSVLLLEHCRDAFADHDRLATAVLLHALVDRGDDSPWADWWGRDVEAGELKGPGSRLARMLKPYGIEPRPIRLGTEVMRGYQAADFADAWDRMLPPFAIPPEKDATDATEDTTPNTRTVIGRDDSRSVRNDFSGGVGQEGESYGDDPEPQS
jgi:hypothetical protein